MDIISFLLGAIVGYIVFSPIAWAVTRETWTYIYGEAPWSWRVYLGPWAYENWLKRRRNG